ncbi:hypothetical protein [Enterococcus faecalis]
MTKYAKITKYFGRFNTDKRNGLEIGKEYELVEKEETPTFKTTIDLKYSVQAKIDSLTTEAEHLFKKRDRLEQQAINLSKKARKLNNLIESIKEFE